MGLAGYDVHVGAGTPAAKWAEVVTRAFEQGDWVVQERVDSPPFLYLDRASRPVAHNLIWSLFVFGESYAGGWLRMAPKASLDVVNSTQGAVESCIFEVSQ